MAVSPTLSPLLLLLLFLLSRLSNSEPTQDKQALQSFITKLSHSPRLNWTTSTSSCNWVGITCDPTQTHIRALHLPAVGLVGPIPPNTIGRLTQLRVLSLHSNRLTGTLPSDFSNLTNLHAFYIGHNNLTGFFPQPLTRLTRLTHLDLSYNHFSGVIPTSIANFSRLSNLFLQYNNFSGSIPNFSHKFYQFNVSRNTLNGSIPSSLSKFPASAFSGNLQLCGGPLPPCTTTAIVPSSPATITQHYKKKTALSKTAIIGIAIGATAIVLCLFACAILCMVKRKFTTNDVHKPKPPGGPATSSSKDEGVTGSTTGAEGGERSRLMFVSGGGGVGFDLEDLLRASAEVLGKGSVGTSYKAVLEEGTTVVVKRLKEVVAGKREFEERMEVLGRGNHRNVVALRAYYFSKDEKLLVTDYFPGGSLSALLRGMRYSHLLS